MNKKSNNQIESINWIKAEKPYPKKTQTVSSFLNSQFDKNKSLSQKQNPFSNSFSNIKKSSYEDESDESIFDDKSKRSNETSGNKVGLKDLCDEDKQRIGNLVKELAKLSEEKGQIEKTLEEEKIKRENELREMLRQQEYLLNDKEDLLNKLSKIQKKLTDTRRQKKCESLLNKKNNEDNNLVSNSLPPRPSNKKNSNFNELKCKAKESNDMFNPYKSSTPKNLSPRSLSPIPKENLNFMSNNRNNDTLDRKIVNQNEDLKKYVVNDQHSEDLKKIELMKQRMELVEEQTKLKQLLEQQEEIIKEKQSQIMLQQKIHRERLEELSKLKEQNQVHTYEMNNQISQDINNQQIVSQQNPNNLNYINPSVGSPYFQFPQSSVQNQAQFQNFYDPILNIQNQIQQIEQLQPKLNLNQQNLKRESLVDDENLDGLVNIVYEKLLLKKNSNNKLKIKIPMQTENEIFLNDKPLECSITSSSNRQEDDECIIDFIIEQTKKENENNQPPRANSKKSTKSFTKKFQQYLNNDIEESKLIEELFFIK